MSSVHNSPSYETSMYIPLSELGLTIQWQTWKFLFSRERNNHYCDYDKGNESFIFSLIFTVVNIMMASKILHCLLFSFITFFFHYFISKCIYQCKKYHLIIQYFLYTCHRRFSLSFRPICKT